MPVFPLLARAGGVSRPCGHARQGRVKNGREVWYRGYRKWYNEDPEIWPEVDFIEQPMTELADEDVCFLRIGEDCDATGVCGCFGENPFDMELLRGFSVAAAV